MPWKNKGSDLNERKVFQTDSENHLYQIFDFRNQTVGVLIGGDGDAQSAIIVASFDVRLGKLKVEDVALEDLVEDDVVIFTSIFRTLGIQDRLIYGALEAAGIDKPKGRVGAGKGIRMGSRTVDRCANGDGSRVL